MTDVAIYQTETMTAALNGRFDSAENVELALETMDWFVDRYDVEVVRDPVALDIDVEKPDLTDALAVWESTAAAGNQSNLLLVADSELSSDSNLGLGNLRGPYAVARRGISIADAVIDGPQGERYTPFDGVSTAVHEIGHNLLTERAGANPSGSCGSTEDHGMWNTNQYRDGSGWASTPMSYRYCYDEPGLENQCATPITALQEGANIEYRDLRYSDCVREDLERDLWLFQDASVAVDGLTGAGDVTTEVFGTNTLDAEARLRFRARPADSADWTQDAIVPIDSDGEYGQVIRQLRPDRGYEFQTLLEVYRSSGWRIEQRSRLSRAETNSYDFDVQIDKRTSDAPTFTFSAAVRTSGKYRVSYRYREPGADWQTITEPLTIVDTTDGTEGRAEIGLDGLTDQTEYEWEATLENSDGRQFDTITGNYIADTERITDYSVSSTSTGATIELTPDGLNAAENYGFDCRYRPADSDVEWQRAVAAFVSRGDPETIELTDLSSDTIYEWEVSLGILRGDELDDRDSVTGSLLTAPESPAIETVDVSRTAESAEVTVTPDNLTAEDDWGVLLYIDGESVDAQLAVTDGTPATLVAENLSPDERYEYRVELSTVSAAERPFEVVEGTIDEAGASPRIVDSSVSTDAGSAEISVTSTGFDPDLPDLSYGLSIEWRRTGDQEWTEDLLISPFTDISAGEEITATESLTDLAEAEYEWRATLKQEADDGLETLDQTGGTFQVDASARLVDSSVTTDAGSAEISVTSTGFDPDLPDLSYGLSVEWRRTGDQEWNEDLLISPFTDISAGEEITATKSLTDLAEAEYEWRATLKQEADDGLKSLDETEGTFQVDASARIVGSSLTAGARTADISVTLTGFDPDLPDLSYGMVVEWRQTGNQEWNENYLLGEFTDISPGEEITVTDQLTGLTADTEYEWRATLQKDEDVDEEGALVTLDEVDGTFETNAESARIVDSTALVTDTTTTISVTSTGLDPDLPALSYGMAIQWRQTGNQEWNEELLIGAFTDISPGEEITVTEEITDLPTDTEYEWRATLQKDEDVDEAGSLVTLDEVDGTFDTSLPLPS